MKHENLCSSFRNTYDQNVLYWDKDFNKIQESVGTQGKNLAALSWTAIFSEVTLDLNLVGKQGYYYLFCEASSTIYD